MAMPAETAKKTVTTAALDALLSRFPVHATSMGANALQYRQSGNSHIAPTHVLLHGIGSGSASWVHQLVAAQASHRLHLLAWDAPGYAGSSPLPMEAPDASAYALRLWQWLDAMGATAPITLVGHSLGCLVAAFAARTAPARVSRLILLAPAQGYARAPAPERDKKLQDRLAVLASLGPLGMAQKRGHAMLSPQASEEQRQFVQGVMAQIIPAGYSQAARLLAHGDLLADLAKVTCPITVASGEADGITAPAGCQAVAAAVQTPYISLGAVGHVCALEAATAVSHLIGLMAPEGPL